VHSVGMIGIGLHVCNVALLGDRELNSQNSSTVEVTTLSAFATIIKSERNKVAITS